MRSQAVEERWHFLCGLPEERKKIEEVFTGFPIISGQGKFKLQEIIARDCQRIVSVGTAGGLWPKSKVGDICLASVVVDAHFDYSNPDQDWNIRALAELSARGNCSAYIAPWYSSGVPDSADTVAQRIDLFSRYKAWGIDNETRFACAFAQQRGIKFNVLRTISDDASETLPLAARGQIMNTDGTVNLDYLLRAIARASLFENLDLFKVAMDFGKALSALGVALAMIEG